MIYNNVTCACLDHADVKECSNCELCLEYGGNLCPLEDRRSDAFLPLFTYLL